MILVAIFAVFLLIFCYIYWDYTRHKQPLLAIDPEVQYTFFHHLHVVTIPTIKYRIKNWL